MTASRAKSCFTGQGRRVFPWPFRRCGTPGAWAVLLAGVLFAPAGFGFEFSLQDQVLLTDIDGATNDGRLGRAVAIGDDVVVMGAPEKTGGGATYGYRIIAGRQLDLVREYPPQSSPSRYGGTLVIDRDWLAVGHASDDAAIEIYRRSGDDFVLVRVLQPPQVDGIAIRNFGSAMDLENGFLIVGDSSANVGSAGNAGAVLIFRQNAGGTNNWGLDGVLTENPPVRSNGFGDTVAIGNDIAVVGDPDEERAFLYQRDGFTWLFSRFLTGVNGQPDDEFGATVAAEGDVIAVGATNGNNAQQPSNSGSVHIFERDAGGEDQFGQVAELVGSQAEFIDGFGASMRIRQGVLAVGSPGANRAYLFAVSRSTDTWGEVTVVAPPPVPFGNADFGRSVDYRRGSLVVGADDWNDVDRNRFGAVFLYENALVRRCGSFDVIFCDTFEGP